MKPILEVNNLSKKYKIGGKQSYYSLRDAITNLINIPFKGKDKLKVKDEFWALQNVTFQVMSGEVLGIIGRNGAGKSTLLKILSQITPPTEGEAILRGRIASLLEVGTGFHPELTGRENIFLNGAIMGMTRKEIRKKFDEIVDFSEVEEFLDTPVKHYSSGMYMRLAFAVAAHLEPEILLIDEVLAVGDAAFQQKCFGKINEVKKQGRTILLVSHNMSSIQNICTNVLMLNEGKTEGIKETSAAVREYLYGKSMNSSAYFNAIKQNPNKEAYIIEAKCVNNRGRITNKFKTSESINLEIIWKNIKGVPVNPNITIINQFNQIVLAALDTPVDFDGKKKTKKGTYVSKVEIPKYLLNTGDYSVHIALDNAVPKICYDNHAYALSFVIHDPISQRSLARGNFTNSFEKVILLPVLDWNWKLLKK